MAEWLTELKRRRDVEANAAKMYSPARMPEWMGWTVHNLIGHPLSEVIFLCGFERLSNWVHDASAPRHIPGMGRG